MFRNAQIGIGKAVLGLGGPMVEAKGGGNTACWGDSTKHSSRDKREAAAVVDPFPNLKEGMRLSEAIDFIETQLVV